jgi:putative holliday junction resolvase
VARIIALDVGSKRIGVAASDELGLLATPRGAIHRQSYNKDAAAIVALADELEAERVVVGLPLGLSGHPTAQTLRVQQFAEMLTSRLSIPVELWDERLTTIQAYQMVPLGPQDRKSGRVDAVAAAVILQDFLDSRRSSSESSSSGS